MIKDFLIHFTTIGTPFAPTVAGDNICPLTYDTAPLGLPTGSGGGGTTGYNAGVSVNAGRDLGIGTELWWYVLVTTTVTQAGGGGVLFELLTDTVANVSATNVLVASPNLAAATLVAQYAFKAQLPASLVYLEFIGVNIDIETNNLGAGAFESALVPNIQQSDLFLSGFAIQ